MTALTHTAGFPALRATSPARQLAHTVQSLTARLSAWSQARRQARADRELWNLALSDARVMTDLTCALSRQDD